MANPESFQTRAQREMKTYGIDLQRKTYNRILAHADTISMPASATPQPARSS